MGAGSMGGAGGGSSKAAPPAAPPAVDPLEDVLGLKPKARVADPFEVTRTGRQGGQQVVMLRAEVSDVGDRGADLYHQQPPCVVTVL